MSLVLPDPPVAGAASFLSGGGALGALMRRHDWSASPLGPPETWPQSLRSVVGLLLNSKFPMFVAWGGELGFLYNDAYAEILGAKHPAALGARFHDIWGEIWSDISPLIDAALAGEAIYREDLPLTMNRKGFDEDTWFTFSYSPVRDESGEVAGMFCAVAETTDRVLAQRREVEAKLRQQRMFEQAPGFICTLSGPEHRFDFANDAYQRVFGPRDFVGRTVREVFPELHDQGYYEVLDRVYATGERFVAAGRPARLTHADGRVEDRVLDFVYAPISDLAGNITGVFCEGFDVTERRRADEHLRLMVNELNHRVKNTLATVQGIVVQTLRGAAIPRDVREVLTARLLALAAAHDVLTDEKWRGADVRELLEQAAAPYADLAGRKPLVLEGPNLYLPPRTAIALALAFHELATNAAKYGALSAPGGQVRVSWNVSRAPKGDRVRRRLELVWREVGGPPVVAPTRSGFGTRLIQRGLAVELGEAVRLDFRPEGLVCTMNAVLPDHDPQDDWSDVVGLV